MQVGVLFHQDGVLALNKPAGMCSQGPKTGPIPELWEMVRQRFKKGFIAHRIDKFTTGVNLAGASRTEVGYLQRNWHQITRKVYLAVIRSPDWDESIVDKPLKGKSAVTSFKVLERSGPYALVQCELVQNGRTHQIRKHMKSLGHPIVGDQRYKGPKTDVREGQLLHAWRMQVRLPNENGEPGYLEEIQAPIPEDFRSFDFSWSIWDAGSNDELEEWSVPANWRR